MKSVGRMIFVTDFAEVEMGPKFKALWNEYVGDELKKAPRRGTKKRYWHDKIIAAVNVMALAEWNAGGVLRKTP